MTQECKLVFLLAFLFVLLFFVGAVQATEITRVTWDAVWHVIRVDLDAWPGGWNDWTMYVNGIGMPVQEDERALYVYPNGSPVLGKPQQLVIGTRETAAGTDMSGLTSIDFPCCGTLQFEIPDDGLTNLFEFNVADFGCSTASSTDCPPGDWTVHYGDLEINDTETFVIEDAKYFQQGYIYVNDQATLIIRNSELMLDRADVAATVHVYINVASGATLVIDNSYIHASAGAFACILNNGVIDMVDSETEIHYLDMMADSAQLQMVRSSMVNPYGGILQMQAGSASVTDSTIASLGLTVPAGGHLNATGLQSGVYYELWDVHEMIPDSSYDLVLERTYILEDDLSGDLEHGPYERGWSFMLDRDACVNISNSELRKVYIDTLYDTAEFSDLRAGVPSSLHYRDITLTDVVITGEWGFTMAGTPSQVGDVTFHNCNYLFLQPRGYAIVRLINSHIVELIPRGYIGTMFFENGLWTEAGEFVYGYNVFSMRGSLRIDEGVRWNLVFGGRVTRGFKVFCTDQSGQPLEGLTVKTWCSYQPDNRGTYITDAEGKVEFDIKYYEQNYARPESPSVPRIEVWSGEEKLLQQDLDFFTETPVLLKLSITPSPDPMTWSVAPHAISADAIEMTATTVTHPAGVEYYFDETSGNPGGTDSGWQDGPTYTDGELQNGIEYCYQVKARDKSTEQNETEWSTADCASPSCVETNAVFRVDKAGNVYADAAYYGTDFLSGSGDVAEWVLVSEPVESGDVLELDPDNSGHYRKSRGKCSDLVAGVVSTDPGFILGGQSSIHDSRFSTFDRALLALVGIVPVKVTDEGGPIQPGDLLVSSSTPGYAMKWNSESDRACGFIGKALDFMKNDLGTILVLLVR